MVAWPHLADGNNKRKGDGEEQGSHVRGCGKGRFQTNILALWIEVPTLQDVLDSC
jgi:hypothetical protein